MEKSMRPRQTICCFILILVVLALAATCGNASEFQRGRQQVHISNLHQINDDLYVWTQNLTVDGAITGDLVAGAYSIDINGNVNGSTNVFGNSVSVGGTTHGSVRAFAGSVFVDGMVGGSVVSAGGNVTLEKGGVIAKEAHLFGGRLVCEGTVLGDLNAYGEQITLSGTVEGDAILHGKTITVIAPAIIKGKLICSYSESLDIDTAGGVIIGNGVEIKQKKDEDGDDKENGILTTIVMKSSQVLAAFLFGIIALALMPGYTRESVTQVRTRFSMTSATGLLSLAVTFLAALFAVIALVCLAIGAILADGSGAILAGLLLVIAFLLLPVSAAGAVIGAIIFYAGKIVVAFLVGYVLVHTISRDSEPVRRWHLLVGLAVLAFLFTIPYLGTLLYFLVCTTGAGAIVLATIKVRNELLPRSAASSAPEKI
jgi:cytoskeletal protein CcmA (bactofilin family)